MRAERSKTLLAAAILFAINAYVVRNVFTAEFLAQMGSIEGVYIGLARYIAANWRDLSWFPVWYGGIPFQNAYPPVFPVLAAAATAGGASPALAYHALAAAFYCLGPVTLFWMARRFSGSLAPSFVAGWLYSLFSPSTLLVQAIRRDAGGVFQPRRVQALIQYGEVPHLAALTLLPVAIVLLDLAIRKRCARRFVLAAVAAGAVALTNWLGAFALAAAALAYLLALWSRRGWLVAACAALYAYVLAMPWIPPSTLAAVYANAEHGGGLYPASGRNLACLGLLLFAAALAGLWLERLKTPLILRFAVLFSGIIGTIVLAAYWLGVALVPQPQRFHFELEMALVLAAVFAAWQAVARLNNFGKAAVVCALVVFCAWQAPRYRAAADRMSRPMDIRSTTEYRAARWFEENMGGRRVFAPGSVSLWMLAFTDTPQLSGGFEQGITNPNIDGIIYQLYTGQGAGDREDEIGELWLKAYGVEAVFVGQDVYHAFRNRRKFSGRFPELWRDGGDAIYAVPQRSGSLAHVVGVEDMVAREPRDGVDADPLRPYVAALDDPALPLADFRWVDRHRATVAAQMRPRQMLSLQIAYHPGWHATVAGAPRRTYRDRLGLVAVDAACNGRCTVELNYDGGIEMRLARLLSWSGLAVGLGSVVRRRAGARMPRRPGQAGR
jgi:hypothetical protein